LSSTKDGDPILPTIKGADQSANVILRYDTEFLASGMAASHAMACADYPSRTSISLAASTTLQISALLRLLAQ